MKKGSRFRLNGEIIESIIFIILGLFIMISALNMNTYGSWALAPGLFPLIISILLLLLSLSLFLQGVKKNKKETEGTGEKKKEKTEEDKINWIGVLFVFGFSLLYCFTLPIIHFIPASLIYLAVMMFFLKEKRWWLVGIITAATTFGLYYFFGILLKVILP